MLKSLLITLAFITLITLTACGSASQAAPLATPAEVQTSEGQTLFAGNCSACHGPTGAGLAGLGKPLTTSRFVAGQADEALLEFVKTGRPLDDPLNTSGIAMPPKGGNPALTDAELLAIIGYIRTIQESN